MNVQRKVHKSRIKNIVGEALKAHVMQTECEASKARILKLKCEACVDVREARVDVGKACIMKNESKAPIFQYEACSFDAVAKACVKCKW